MTKQKSESDLIHKTQQTLTAAMCPSLSAKLPYRRVVLEALLLLLDGATPTATAGLVGNFATIVDPAGTACPMLPV